MGLAFVRQHTLHVLKLGIPDCSWCRYEVRVACFLGCLLKPPKLQANGIIYVKLYIYNVMSRVWLGAKESSNYR